ncbi:MAG TPA: ABC transporter ATP-binding protein [Kribbellaceae bacterium]
MSGTRGERGGGDLLDARVVVEREGGFRLDVELTVAAGEVVALLGPNGAGKTTALRALAGLTPLTGGWVRMAGRTVDEPARRAWTPAERRPAGVVFQEYLLFPHLSALENVAFGPRCHGLARRAARAVAASWLERVGLVEYADRKPRELFGGQAQRVALARALALDPAVLLLDEPLAALDARTRLDTRAELHRHLTAHPGAALLVTHDPLDALVLADRLVIVEDGRVVQEGDAATIAARPRTDYVARLVGLNLYRGHASGRLVTVTSAAGASAATPAAGGAGVAVAGGFMFTVAEAIDGDVFVAFPPAAVAVYAHQPDGSPRNTWPAVVAGIQRHGDNLRIQLDGPITAAADITPTAAAQLHLAPGQEVWAAVKATETLAYPAVPHDRATHTSDR